MQTAQVVYHGSIQSVRLPENLHLEGTEVFVKPVGRSLLLIPKTVDRWDMLRESLDEFTADYMEDRGQPPQQRREGLFE
jgi:antitoxin VapB